MNVIAGLSAVEAGGCCLAGDQARALLKALGDPLRLQLVEALVGGERCVCELTDQLQQAQPKLSFHLKVLKDAGLITARQQGRWTYYRLVPGAMVELRRWLDQLISCCGDGEA